MSSKIKVYCRIPAVADCGVGYYRMWKPLMIAREKGALDFCCHEFTWGNRDNEKDPMGGEPSDADMAKAGKWSDLMYFARNDIPQYIAQAGGLRDYFLESDKKYKPIILDIDDNVQATRPYNPGYRSFHPNSPHLAWNIKSLGVFDAITVSTEDLKEFYSKYTDKEKIYVCPNSLDFKERDAVYESDFSGSELFKKKDGEIRIGWTGSAAHWENLKHIEPALIEIMKKYPETTFYYTGIFADLFKDEAIKDRVHRLSWSTLKDWSKFNRECNFDIALAPLMDNDFNRAKSNLRVLEYASARFPVIASPISPYKCFKDDEVIFAMEEDEWFKALDEMVKSKELRQKYAQNLYNRAKKDYNIDKNYKIWVDCFKDVIAKKPKVNK